MAEAHKIVQVDIRCGTMMVASLPMMESEMLSFKDQAVQTVSDKARECLTPGQELKRVVYVDDDGDLCTLTADTLADALLFTQELEPGNPVWRLEVQTIVAETVVETAPEVPEPEEAPSMPQQESCDLSDFLRDPCAGLESALLSLNGLMGDACAQQLLPKLASAALHIIESEQLTALNPFVATLMTLQEGKVQLESLPAIFLTIAPILIVLPREVLKRFAGKFEVEARRIIAEVEASSWWWQVHHHTVPDHAEPPSDAALPTENPQRSTTADCHSGLSPSALELEARFMAEMNDMHKEMDAKLQEAKQCQVALAALLSHPDASVRLAAEAAVCAAKEEDAEMPALVPADEQSNVVMMEEVEAMSRFVGSYEMRPPSNDWHHVSISHLPDGGKLKWTNRADVHWELHPTKDPSIFDVSSDCPYKQDSPQAIFNDSGVVGPHGELYVKVDTSVLVTVPAVNDSQSSDGWKRLCTLACRATVGSLKIGADWKDQGWGNRKGRVRVALRRPAVPDSGDIHVADCFGLCGAGPERKRGEYEAMEKTFGPEEPIVALAKPGDLYVFEYTVGGGGGHALYLKSFGAATEMAGVAAAATETTGPNVVPEADTGAPVVLPTFSAKALHCAPLLHGVEAQEDDSARGDVTAEFAAILPSVGASQAYRIGRIALPVGLGSAVPVCAKVCVVNDGAAKWPETTVVQLIHGDGLGLSHMELGALRPGEAAEIVMDMLLPSKDGPDSGRSAWALVDSATGTHFGPLFFFESVWIQQ